MAIKHENKRGYVIRKYKDLYDFYITQQDKLAYELNPSKKHVGPTWPTKIVMESIVVYSG